MQKTERKNILDQLLLYNYKPSRFFAIGMEKKIKNVPINLPGRFYIKKFSAYILSFVKPVTLNSVLRFAWCSASEHGVSSLQ
jgi:hypothetical protein